MIIKDYFTDGLVQVAIVLSLLRSDLDSYFSPTHVRSSIRPPRPLFELHEIHHGPLSSFMTTDLMIRDRSLSGGYLSKSVDSRYPFSSVLRDLHSLSYYRRLDGIDTNIYTWLVSDAGAARPVLGDRPAQNDLTASTEQASPSQVAAEADTVFDPPEQELDLESELTKEDMELINILYMQDIDLGVGRDVFDLGLRGDDSESMKQKSDSGGQKLSTEDKSDRNDSRTGRDGPLQTLEFPQLNLSGRYDIDTETGELILVSSPVGDESLNLGDINQFLHSVAVTPPVASNQVTSLADLLQPHEVDPPRDVLIPDSEVELLDSLSYLYGSVTEQQPVGYEHQSSLDQHLADVLSMLDTPSSSVDGGLAAGGAMTWETSASLDTVATSLLNHNDISSSLVRNVSMSSYVGLMANDTIPQMQEFTPCISPSEFPSCGLDNESLSLMPYTFSSTSAHLILDSLSSVDNSLGVYADSQRFLAPSDFTEAPINVVRSEYMPSWLPHTTMDVSSLSGFGIEVTDTVAAVPATSGLVTVDLDSHLGPFSGYSGDMDRLAATVPELAVVPLARQMSADSNNSLFQQLLFSELPDDFDLDEVMVETDLSGYPVNETWSSDSAVSSMVSPGQQSFASSSASALTDVVEGASGGTPDEMTPSKCLEKYDVKHEAANDYNFGDSFSSFASFRNRYHANSTSNCSDGSDGPCRNSSSLPIEMMKNVRHNHSYPLMPGQRSRSEIEEDARREKEEHATRSRDEKRAKMLKIPLTMDEIIESSVDHFTELLTQHDLSDTQLQLVRDIRRRGKNKLAAQNCRKRKMEVIQTVEEQVTELRRRRDQLRKERSNLDRGTAALKEKFARLERELFSRLQDESGHEYDPAAYSLLQTDDGGLFIVPRDNNSASAAAPSGADRSQENDRKHKPKKKE